MWVVRQQFFSDSYVATVTDALYTCHTSLPSLLSKSEDLSEFSVAFQSKYFGFFVQKEGKVSFSILHSSVKK